MHMVERLLAVVAAATIALYAASRIYRAVWSEGAVQGFEHRQPTSTSNVADLITPSPEIRLWSQKRVKEYQESITSYTAPAIGILRIPKVDIEAPILEGTDDLALNRGVGRITGTAQVGENGNVGIAGHRDGFFRGLKDVHTGDLIEMLTSAGTESYIVDSIEIVKPDDVSVLAPRERPSLTLVTCYPFYFIGSAPKRYIVHASLGDPVPARKHAPQLSSNNAMPSNGKGPRSTLESFK
jgi:sortase A